MPETWNGEVDPLGEFEPETGIVRLRRDEDLSDGLLQFLPERNQVAPRDQIRANGLRVEPSKTKAQAPNNTERFRRAPLAIVPFDRVPAEPVSPAALSLDRRSLRVLQMLFIATASVAFVGVFLGLRASHRGTPAETTSTAFNQPPQDTSQSSLAFPGPLEVTSSPEGARVFLDDALVGVTPLLLADLPIGRRAVRVEMDGHKPSSFTVRIVGNEPTTAAAELRPSQVGSDRRRARRSDLAIANPVDGVGAVVAQ